MQKRPTITFFCKGNSFYIHMMGRLAMAFEEMGWKTHVCPILLDDEAFTAYASERKSDVFFEINKVATSNRRVPKGSKHISWIQDVYAPAKKDDIQSDILYCICEPRVLGYDFDFPENGGVFLNGIDPDIYYPKANVGKKCDFSHVGFIPYNHDYDSHYIFLKDQSTIPGLTFGKIIERLQPHLDWIIGELDYHRMINVLNEMLIEHVGRDWIHQIQSVDLQQLLVLHIPRFLDRYLLLLHALKVSPKVRIYGTKTWRTWPEFEDIYYHYVTDLEDIRDIYQFTRINLHVNSHGWAHFRIFDIMACGGVVTVNNSSRNRLPGGIENFFTPNEHYLAFSPDTLHETLAEALDNPKGLEDMGKAAAEEVHSNHTWKHRARRILNDLEKL